MYIEISSQLRLDWTGDSFIPMRCWAIFQSIQKQIEQGKNAAHPGWVAFLDHRWPENTFSCTVVGPPKYSQSWHWPDNVATLKESPRNEQVRIPRHVLAYIFDKKEGLLVWFSFEEDLIIIEFNHLHSKLLNCLLCHLVVTFRLTRQSARLKKSKRSVTFSDVITYSE